MASSGRADVYRVKLLKPEYGNYLSHELLFSGTIRTLPFSPSRLWRFSPHIFKGKGIRDAKSPFGYITPETGVRDYSATSGVDRSTVEMILINTDQLLDLRTQDGDFKRFADAGDAPRLRRCRSVLLPWRWRHFCAVLPPMRRASKRRCRSGLYSS